MSTKAVRQAVRRTRRIRAGVRLEAELAKVRGRIRAVDAFTAGLTLLAATLAYALAMVGLDHVLHIPDWARQTLLGLFIAGSGFYLYSRLLRPLFSQVNVYYAARALERSSPDTKNGLVNWLDLREEPLPPAIRGAVQEQAALELQGSDLDEAVPVRKPMRLFFAAAGLVLVFFIVTIVLPDQIGSLLKRTFVPFGPIIIPTYTRLELVQPEVEGEPVDDPINAPVKEIPVPPRVSVPVGVKVHGAIPAELNLEYQASLSEKPFTISMTPPGDEYGRQPWTATIPSDRIIGDGLWFKVRGGDGQTRQYRLVLSSKLPPSPSDVEVVYRYPAYTRQSPKKENIADLRALRGAKVSLSFTADQPVKGGTLVVESKDKMLKTFALEPDGKDVRKLHLREPFELTSAMAKYSVKMVSPDDREGVTEPYSITVEKDQSPSVEVLRIGQEEIQPKQDVIKLPLNATVPVAGQVHDDIAANQVRLRLRAPGGPDLQFLAGKPFAGPLQQATGYPQPAADYELVLDLNKLAGPDKKPAELKVGDILDFWVEATDTMPPQPNVGTSRHFQIELTEPVKQEQQEQQPNEQNDPKNGQQNKDQKPKDGSGESNKDQNPDQGDGKKKDSKPDGLEKGDPQKQPQGSDKNKPNQEPQKSQDKNQSPDKGEKSDGKPGEKSNNQADKDSTAKPKERSDGSPEQKDGSKSEKNNSEKIKGTENDQPDSQPATEQQKEADDVAQKADKLAKAIEEAQKEKNPAEQQKQPDGADKEKQNTEKRTSAEKPKAEGQKGEQEKAKPMPGQEKETAPKPDGTDQQKKDGDKTEPKPDSPLKGEQKPQQPGKTPDMNPADKPEKSPPKPGEQDMPPKNEEKGAGDQPKNNPPKEGEKPPTKPEGQEGQKKPEKPGDPKDKKAGEKGEKPETKPGDQGDQTKPMPDASKPPSQDKKPGESGQDKPGQEKNTAKDDQQKDGKPGEKPESKPKTDPSKPNDGKPDDPMSQFNPSDRQGKEGDPSPPDDVNEKHAKQSTDLLLETFRDKMAKGEIDKDVLKKMNWTEKELQQFMDQYKKLKDQGLLPTANETAAGAGKKDNLKSGGPLEKSTRSGDALDLAVDPAAEPPPELRNSLSEFTKRLSKPRKK